MRPIAQAWIIGTLRKRHEEREEPERAGVELPLPAPPPVPRRPREDAPVRSPACVVIDLC